MTVDESSYSSQSDGSQQPQIVVDDPGDFGRTRQLRAVFDAKDAYIETRRSTGKLLDEGDIGTGTMNRRNFRYIQDFAMTMEPLLKSSEAGREMWTEKEYRVAGVAKAAQVPNFDDALQTVIEAADHGDEQAIEALQDWRQFQENINRNLKEKKSEKRRIRAATVEWTWGFTGLQSIVSGSIPKLLYPVEDVFLKFKPTAPPTSISNRVFRDLQDILRQMGLGLEFDTEQQTKIDDELLEEVDEWRQKNVN